MTQTKIFTISGFKKFQKELEDLKTSQRQKIIKQIQRAQEHGDLTENAEYADAKDTLRILEDKIEKMEGTIKNAKVADENHKDTSKVSIGSTVKLTCGKKKRVLTIVGAHEADPAQGKISNESPIGQALLGKRKDDRVQIKIPTGTLDCKILEIE